MCRIWDWQATIVKDLTESPFFTVFFYQGFPYPAQTFPNRAYPAYAYSKLCELTSCVLCYSKHIFHIFWGWALSFDWIRESSIHIFYFLHLVVCLMDCYLFSCLFLDCLSELVHLNLKINFSFAGFDWIRESSIHRSNFDQSSKCKLLHKSVSGLEFLSTQNPPSLNFIINQIARYDISNLYETKHFKFPNQIGPNVLT